MNTARVEIDKPDRSKLHHIALVESAIEMFGSQKALAEALGCSQQYISWLLNSAEQISVEMAASFDRVTKGKISKQQLRPDFFKAELNGSVR